MLSVIIITKNEAEHIGRCLSSVSWADEIIVFDSGSTDQTVAICESFGAHVYVTDWPGFGPQKQRALDKATQPWVLSLDADEYVDDKLRTAIQNVISNDNADAYQIPRLSSYCGRNIHHGGWWPDYVLRLFKRDKGRFTKDVVHETIQVSGTILNLSAPLQHEAFVDPDEVLSKINHYSSLGAAKLYAQGKTSNLCVAVFKGIWTFLRCYFLQASFLDGPEGLMLAISNAEGTYYKYLKLRQLNMQK